MEIWLLCALLFLELWSLALNLMRLTSPSPPPQDDEEAGRRAKELEKRWNDGVSGILGYDLERAKGALRDDDEKR